jgi:hypothetical protein
MRWLLLTALLLPGCSLQVHGRKTVCNCTPPSINDNPQDEPEKQCNNIHDEDNKKICIEAVVKARQEKQP